MSTIAGRVFFAALCGLALISPPASAQRQPSQRIESPVSFTPHHPVQLTYYPLTPPSQVATTEFYRIPRDLYLQITGPDVKTADAFESVRTRGTLLRSFQSLLYDKENPYLRIVDAGAYPVGQYAAATTIGTVSTLTPVSVSSVGVLYGSAGTHHVFWTVNLEDFSAYNGGVNYLLAKKEPVNVRAGAGGVALADLPGQWNGSLTAIASDGSLSTASLYSYGSVNHAPTFVQTDRPLYRPGQLARIRIIVRDGGIGSYRPARGTRRVRVLDPQGSAVYDRTQTLDAFGVLHLDVPISPDAALGRYGIAIGDPQAIVSGLDVQAYKKPEYEANVEPQRSAVLGGNDAVFHLTAKYFFGRPAAGMHVSYSASQQPQYYYVSPFERWIPRRNDYSRTDGSGLTGEDGTFIVRVPTKHTTEPQQLSLSVDVRDASGRTVSTESQILVTPAKFGISVTPSRWFGQNEQPVRIGVDTHEYGDGKPVSRDVSVSIVPQQWSSRQSRYESGSPDFQTTVHTAASGAASFIWTPQKSGFYFITARSVDELGNVSQTVSDYWVSGREEAFPDLNEPLVAFSQKKYSRGEPVKVLITLPVHDRDVLAVVTTDRVTEARVVHITGYSKTIDIARPRDAMGVALTVLLPQESGVLQAQDTSRFDPAPRVLNVSVAAQRAKYQPGEKASWSVHVTDANGKPVRTQLGLSVVDAALLALEPDTTDVTTAFYGRATWFSASANWYRPHAMLRTIANVRSAFANLVKPGSTSDVYSVNASSQISAPLGTPSAALMTGKVRSAFADTAYWVGDAQTDEHGNGRITFTWPDNLTTWVAKAVAVDAGASVGQGNGKTLVTKDFLVRLELPRFLRKGDKTAIGGIAHGTAGAKQAHLRLDIDSDPLDSLVAFDRTLSANASWPYTAPGIGEQTFTLRGTDGTLKDAMQLTIPIESSGTPEHVRDAGKTEGTSTVAVTVPQGYDAGDLHIALTPSIVAQLVQDVRLLDVYPYYCTEQTMSAALPAVFIDNVLRRTHLKVNADQDTKAIVKHALTRLAQLQHGDGSWGWWENDDGHPFMTAYALYGLAEFRKAGFKVNAGGMFDRGVDALVDLLGTQHSDTLRFWGGAQQNSQWNTRAYMLFSLANAAPGRIPSPILRDTIAHAAGLNSYALSVLGLAVHELGDDATARRLVEMLNARAIDNGTYRYWSGESWHYAWEDDPVETTAYALRLNAAIGVDSPATGRILAFLRSEQHGSWWFTTKDTAASIYAIAQTVPDSSPEFSPNETVRVSVDGRLVRSVHINSAILEKNDADVNVPATQLRAGSVVAIERSGSGALYWASDFTRYAPPWVHATSDRSRSIFARLFPKQPPLSVTRTYDAGHRGPWRIGDNIAVTVTVRSDEDVQYVAIEDPFPAGVEYQPLQGQTGQDWSGVQFFDDRAVFFADTVYKRWPVTLHYNLRVTTPGTYTAPGPNAYAMYGPPVAANGETLHVAVTP